MCHVYNEILFSHKKVNHDSENRLMVARSEGIRVGEMGEEGQKVPTSSYKPWRCNIQHGDYS